MQFEHLETLLLVPASLLIMLGALVFHSRWTQRVRSRIQSGSALESMYATFSPQRRRLKQTSFILAAIFIAIAAAQPQWGQTNKPVKRTGVDLVFAIDISKSMLAQDVVPSRLEAARREIKTILTQLGGDRVALVLFTAISFAQSPLTADYSAIRFYLDKMNPNHMPVGGTSLGRAISDSVELLTGKTRDGDDSLSMKRAKNQVIVLISDGEDHESDPVAAAQLAKEHGIKILTLGIGTRSGERIPSIRTDGTRSGFQRDRKGEIVRSKLDEDMLKEIATITGGAYIYFDGENSAANAILEEIEKLEETELETLLKERYRERYYFFLLPALLFLCFGILLSERRRKLGLAGVASVLILLTGCEDALRSKVSEVENAKELLAEGNPTEALAELDGIETKVLSSPELDYNIGTLQHLTEAQDEAREKLARALESDDPSLVFDASINLGLVLGARQEWSDAYKLFQDALVVADANPAAATDEERVLARKNLEAAFLKMYPPCSEIDDEFEENDEPLSATALEELKVPKAVICAEDDDWFRIQAMAGTRVSVRANFEPLRELFTQEEPFLTKPEDAQISLFSYDGQNVVAVDQGSEETLSNDIASRKTARALDRVLVDQTTVGAQSQVLLKVSSSPGRDFRYSLEIETIPPCQALQEASEPNNSPQDASAITPETGPAHLCPGDEDWFKIDVGPGDSFFADVSVSEDKERGTPPAPTLQIMDAETMQVLSEGVEDSGYLTAGIRDFSSATTLLIRVGGVSDDEQGPYKLDTYHFLPCDVGDDRYEENDLPESATELDGQVPVHRYLRLCESDDDYFALGLKEDDPKLHVGVALTAFPADPEDPYLSDIRIDHLSAGGDQILHAGVRPEEQTPDALPLRSLLLTEKLDEKSALLRVRGEQDFYHLVQLNPSQPPQENQDQSESEDQQEREEEENNEDQQNQQDQQDKQDQEDGDKEDQEAESESAQPEEGEEKPSQEEAQMNPQPTDTSEDPEMDRVEDILKSLEETDHNFQMKKALENMPNLYIERDW